MTAEKIMPILCLIGAWPGLTRPAVAIQKTIREPSFPPFRFPKPPKTPQKPQNAPTAAISLTLADIL